MLLNDSCKKLEIIKGVGLGLRSAHFDYILREVPRVPWFEILAENFFYGSSRLLEKLETICAQYPVVFHCVGMNLGSTDPIDDQYFRRLNYLVSRFGPQWVSGHVCWSGVSGCYFHDLLPLPLIPKMARYLAHRIQQVQDILGQDIIVENISSYFELEISTMSEAEFLAELVHQSDCRLLLDINNIYVNSINHDFDPFEYIETLPKNCVKQFHLGGHIARKGLLIDTHSQPVVHEVWRLFEHAVGRFGIQPVSIEWDQDIPEFEVLWGQKTQAERWLKDCSETEE